MTANFFTCLKGWDHRFDPTHFPAFIYNGTFNRLDGDRLIGQIQSAGRFARGRADAPGEFREVVGAVQNRQGILPVITMHHLVPVRDDVVDGATVMAIWDAAIHAARALLGHFCIAGDKDEFLIMLDALTRWRITPVSARDFHKPGWFTHF